MTEYSVIRIMNYSVISNIRSYRIFGYAVEPNNEYSVEPNIGIFSWTEYSVNRIFGKPNAEYSNYTNISEYVVV